VGREAPLSLGGMEVAGAGREGGSAGGWGR